MATKVEETQATEVQDVTEVQANETSNSNNQTESTEELNPIFDEIKDMNPGAAVNVLIQASQMAQSAGALTVRDSVMLAQAISILRPGSI